MKNRIGRLATIRICTFLLILVGWCSMRVAATENWMFYDIDLSRSMAGSGGYWQRSADGWWPFNPNYPNAIPYLGEAEYPSYAVANPLLGRYDIGDAAIIRQHAYWMRALGVQAIVADWTNLNFLDMLDYSNIGRSNTAAIFSVYSTVYSPPKVVIAVDVKDLSEYRVRVARDALDKVYSLYSSYPDLTVKIENDSRPVVIVMADLTNSAWGYAAGGSAPFVDSRFNVKYMGDLSVTTLVEPQDANFYKVSGNRPFWCFIDNKFLGATAGSYRHIMTQRVSAGQVFDQFGCAWMVCNNEQDLVFTEVNGQTTFERQVVPYYSRPPEILLIGRFNAYFSNAVDSGLPSEGTGRAGAAGLAEPTVEYGFGAFDIVRKTLAAFRGYSQSIPGLVGIGLVDGNAWTYWANFPTQYRVSLGAPDEASVWKIAEYYDIAGAVPSSGTSVFIQTRNSFGASPWLQCWPSPVLSTGAVRIRSAASGKYLEIQDGTSVNGAAVQQWDEHGNPWQEWRFVANGGYYRIINEATGKAFDMSGASVENGAQLQQWEQNGAVQQDWLVVPTGSSFYIINRYSGKFLDVPLGSSQNGVQVQQWDGNSSTQQKWTIQ